MKRTEARTNLEKVDADGYMRDCQADPDAVCKLIRQSNDRWTVVMEWEEEDEIGRENNARNILDQHHFADSNALGHLSAKFESAGDAAAIGHDAHGGWSYGTYQIASAPGTMAAFLEFLKQESPDIHRELIQSGGNEGARHGTEAFKCRWQQLAVHDGFGALQREFIKRTHYDPMVTQLKANLHLDVDRYSAALRDVVWSVAVQHGPKSELINNALQKTDLATTGEGTIIERIYSERSNLNTYFPSSNDATHRSLANRFTEESRLALKRLA